MQQVTSPNNVYHFWRPAKREKKTYVSRAGLYYKFNALGAAAARSARAQTRRYREEAVIFARFCFSSPSRYEFANGNSFAQNNARACRGVFPPETTFTLVSSFRLLLTITSYHSEAFRAADLDWFVSPTLAHF